jgi:LytS/YehU family sensor histidine kinase
MIIVVLLYSMFCGITNAWIDRVIGYVNFGGGLYPLHFLTLSVLVNIVWRYSYVFVAWSALYMGFKIYEEWMAERQKAERAETLAQTAQLAMLRYQLNPHFFFNSLSSLLSLISSNPKKAEQILIKISEFMRYSLLSENQQLVPLSNEIEIVRHYLDIEKVRYGKKLVAVVKIDPTAGDYPIPILLVHSLVDNAVKHGIETTILPLRVRVLAEITNGSLVLDVENTGQWIERQSTAERSRAGMGLENTRRRLEHFYPGNHSFEIFKERGTVRVRITLRTNPHENAPQDTDRG